MTETTVCQGLTNLSSWLRKIYNSFPLISLKSFFLFPKSAQALWSADCHLGRLGKLKKFTIIITIIAIIFNKYSVQCRPRFLHH